MRTYILLFSFLFCILNTIRVNAQDGVVLRYAEQIQQGYGSGNQVITPYVVFPASLMKCYADGGAQLTAVKIGLAQDAQNVTVYVKRHSHDARPLYSQKVGALKKGWNTVELNTPYQLTADTLTLGYKATFAEGADQGAGYDNYSSTLADTVFINSMSTWSIISGSFCIHAVVKGSNLPANMATLEPLPLPQYTYSDPFTASYLLRNTGTEPVANVTLNNGATDVTLSGLNVAANATDTVQCTLPLTIGSNNVTVSLASVNGDAQTAAGYNTVQQSIEQRDSLFKHRVVMEESTGNWCQFCVAGIEEIRYMQAHYPDEFISICIHGGEDSLTISDADHNYNDVLKTISGYPDAYMDRLTHVSEPWGNVRRIYSYIQKQAGTVGLWLTARFNADSTALLLNTTVATAQNMAVPSYKVSYVLLEDSLPGTQTNGFSGGSSGAFNGWENLPNQVDVIYNDVARAVYNTVEGATFTTSPLVARQKHTEQFTLPLIPGTYANKRNLRVVALLINSDGTLANGAVAGITNTTTGIGTVNAKLQGNGHTAVYTVNGAKVATASASDVNHLLLPAGVYIVKQGNQAKKIVIK